jgi:lipopolysaccharide transport system permease protein
MVNATGDIISEFFNPISSFMPTRETAAVEDTRDIEIILRADRNRLSLEWRELWSYRDLFLILVWRDFAAKYKQTILGPMWFILQPILITVVFTVVFGHVGGLPTDGLPPLLFYQCGQLGWNYFATNLTSNSATFVNNAALFSKVYFPRLVVPLSTIASNLFAFLIQAFTFLSFFVYFKYVLKIGSIEMDWRVVFLPLVVLQTAALSLAFSLLFSALTAKYRDLVHLMGFLIQVWMYATPVILPLSKFPVHWQWVVALNPMTMIVESFRLMLLGTGTVRPEYVLCSLATTFVTLWVGFLLFSSVEKRFVDTV